MSAYRDAVVAQLRCPKCQTENDPTRAVCEWDHLKNTVYCTNCSHQGTLAVFLARERPTEE